MVCAKRATQTAAAVATAASSVYSSYASTAPTPHANVASVASTSSASAANSGIKGFNYGAFFLDNSAKQQVDFEYEFNRAQNLANTTGWNSARLYTMGEYLMPTCPPCSSKALISRNWIVDPAT